MIWRILYLTAILPHAIDLYKVNMDSLLFVTFSRKKSTSQDVDVKSQICNTIDPLRDYDYATGCLTSYFKTGTGPAYTIQTPNHPGLYDFSKNCGWLIESPENSAIINITFNYFDVEDSKNCPKYDFVMVFQQELDQIGWDIATDPVTNEPQDKGYCGFKQPFYVAAKAKRMFILFHSDGTNRFTGFRATFDMIIKPSSPKIIKIGQDKGEFHHNLGNITAYAEQRGMVTLSCKADASPPSLYEWKKWNNGTLEALRQDLVKAEYPNGTIRFHLLELEDAGSYQCFASNKLGSDQYNVTLQVAEKCLCKPFYNVAWFPKPPYTVYEDHNEEKKGVFYAILNDMFDYICGNCTLGHGETEIRWIDYTMNSFSSSERSLNDLKEDIENNVADIYLPIENFKTATSYRNTKYFFPFVGSPGVALIVIGPEDGSVAQKLFESIFQGWPIFVLVIVMAILAGIVIWMLDTYWNEDEFPRTFVQGIIEGTWWAFITMTTVGYGDIAPRGIPGRAFGVFWILTGLVIISIFTGVISTSLTVIALSTDVKLYGTDIGALENSAEYRMGVIKNAKMKTFSTYAKLKAAMDAREVEGSLIDAYVNAYEQQLFDKFRLNNVFSSNKAYGIVLGEALEQKEILDKILEYKELQEAKIISLIEENVPEQPVRISDTLQAQSTNLKSLHLSSGTKPRSQYNKVLSTEFDHTYLNKPAVFYCRFVKEPIEPESSSEELFKPSNQMFVTSMTVCCIMLAVMTVLGLLYQYLFLVPRQKKIEAAKNLDMCDSKEVKKLDLQMKLMREILVEEVHDFYERWNERFQGLSAKHKLEQKSLADRGKNKGYAGSGPSIRASIVSIQKASEAVEEDIEMQKKTPYDGENSSHAGVSSEGNSSFDFDSDQVDSPPPPYGANMQQPYEDGQPRGEAELSEPDPLEESHGAGDPLDDLGEEQPEDIKDNNEDQTSEPENDNNTQSIENLKEEQQSDEIPANDDSPQTPADDNTAQSVENLQENKPDDDDKQESNINLGYDATQDETTA